MANTLERIIFIIFFFKATPKPFKNKAQLRPV